MGILDKLKKKIGKKEEKPEKPEPSPAKATEGKEKKEEERSREPLIAYRVLKGPHITEKSTRLAQQNQYTFKVFSEATKPEIKKAINEVYGVNVEKVRVINVPSKPRTLGRQEGTKPGFKKAIVKVQQGQSINVFPI